MDDAEHARLRQLLDEFGVAGAVDQGLEACRQQLSDALRAGEASLDHEGLQVHLWRSAVERAFVDSPKYSGLRTARALIAGSVPYARL